MKGKKSDKINYQIGDSVKFNFQDDDEKIIEIDGWIAFTSDDDSGAVVELADDYSHLGWDREGHDDLDDWESVGCDRYWHILKSEIIDSSRGKSKNPEKWENLFPPISSLKNR